MQDKDLEFLYDDPEVIKLCLNCSKRECNNCLSKNSGTKREYHRGKIDHDKFMKLYNKCFTDVAIARELGVDPSSVRNHRKRYGLETKHPKNRFNEEKFMKLYEQCLTDKEIADELDLATSYICLKRQQLGLPANYRTKRRKINAEGF